MDSEKLDNIKYALTLRASQIPGVREEVYSLCGCLPERTSMREDFAACGHGNLLPFWERMVARFPDAASLADQVWADYEKHLAELKTLPSLGEMAANFGGAVLRDLKAGRPRRSPEQVESILTICRECQYWRADDQRCGKCGCWIRKKASWAQEHCKLGKW
ncbi:MAG: hypothetical protein ACFUZC_16880 [Chthoniobacteraceae bacterium]